MKASDYIINFFEDKGVKIIFGYIGGMITHLVDSIAQNENIHFVQTYHEQTAAIAAEGYSRSTGNIGVAISTSGPGVTNMITGIANAHFDSIPVIYITGQVNSYEYKYDKNIRQQGFQEMDVIAVTKPITKYSVLIDKVENLRYELEKAYFLAKEGRQGPVVLDIPMNIQREDIDPDKLCSYSPLKINYNQNLDEVLNLISKAKRPLILIGGGAKQSASELSEFIERTGLPFVTSLMGIGIVHNEDKNQGMIGSYGNRMANIAIANSDLVIALGTRLDTRQTGALYTSFVKGGKIIHVDIDENELENHRLDNRIKIHSPVASFLINLNKRTISVADISNWMLYLKKLKEKYNQVNEVNRFVDNKSPYNFLDVLNKYTKEGDSFCVDIGQNQMWAAQTIQMKKDQSFYTSGGLAPMGYALAAAVGCGFVNKNNTTYVICGDGGFHIATQSLALISQYDLPVKVIVFNNESLGMITQFQELYFEKRMKATTKSGGYLPPNVEGFANTYNLKYFRLDENDLSNNLLLNNIFEERNCIVEFFTDGLTKVSPKLEYNQPIENVSPFLSEDELKNNMIFIK